MDDVIVRATTESSRLHHNYVGTEHVLLAIAQDDPELLEPYGVTWATLVPVIAIELLRIVGELRDASSIVEPVRRTAEQQTRTELSPLRRVSGVTPRLSAILAQARSSSSHDVLAAMLDEDGNLAVIVLDRLGVPLDDLRRQLD
jgi:ATP-dependent Clp protease ATP-binding subunit ClpA